MLRRRPRLFATVLFFDYWSGVFYHFINQLVNNYDVGGRQLRVDKADHEAPSAPTATTTSTGPAVGAAVPNATGSISIEAINDVLGRLSNTQLLEMLTQMKNMATANPEHLRQMLSSNPSMTFAVFQAMVMMNMIDPTIVQQIMSQSQQATPSAHQPPQQQHQQQPHTGNLAAEQQKALIAQIMSLTAEQINALPAGQREQIIQLVLESLLLTNILCVASATRLSTSLILT